VTTAAITADRLSLAFGDVRAVNGLSLDVRPGEVFGLLGHNGAGKTTTVRLLNGLLRPDEGGATVLGHDPWREGPALRKRAGVLTEVAALDGRLTAREILTFHGRLYDIEQLARRVDEMLGLFGLTSERDKQVGGFSKGMRQRLALSRAFLNDPEVLFLDEPVAALDPVAARQVHELILAHVRGRGRTVLLCTHNLVEAERLCDRVAVLESGKVLVEGEPSALLEDLDAPREVVFELHPEDTASAIAALPEARPDGPTHLRLPRLRREAIPQLIHRLSAAGVRIFQVTRVEPTLEEIYFGLHSDEAPRNMGDVDAAISGARPAVAP